MKYVYIGEFDLLKQSREDIQSKPWARAPEREAMNLYFKLQRAQEEIVRVNVEIRRVMTRIVDEEDHLKQTYQQISRTNPRLSFQIKKKLKHLRSINRIHVQRFNKLQAEPQYTGPYTPGRVIRSLTSSMGLNEERGNLNYEDESGEDESDDVDSESERASINDGLDATISITEKCD